MKNFLITQVRRVIVTANIAALTGPEAIEEFLRRKDPSLPNGIVFDQSGQNRPPKIMVSQDGDETE